MQNIQINKAVGENEKCVFYFKKKLNGLFGQPNIFIDCFLHYTLTGEGTHNLGISEMLKSTELPGQGHSTFKTAFFWTYS